ncbi:MAG: ATP-binding protein [Bifidobacteriaceae bacterium]|nr:ATP-binding protein [Bifidobacteriaceae bacterium]
MLIGRVEEVATLRACFESPNSHFVAVYGRRRVGKTHLVKTLFQDDFAFYCTGLAKEGTRRQLANFADSLADSGESRSAPPQDWFEAFRRLRDLPRGRSSADKAVVFLDELPWMDTHKSDLTSALEWFWNAWASTNDVLLIVCGSATSWLIRKVFADHGGLHNRVTRRVHLEPFTLAECEAFLEAKGVVMARKEIVEAYMVFGGIPFYFDQFDGRFSLAQNIGRLCFSRMGPLRHEYEELYASLFKQPDNHMKVVEALSRRGQGLRRDDIAAQTGLASGGGLSKVLKELEDSGFVRSYQPFGRKRQGALYQLIDSFTLFHFTFIENGSVDPDYWVKYASTGSHSAWSGYAFEKVVHWHERQVLARLGVLGVITRVQAWRSEQVKPGAQIDLVIDRADNVINLCEVKFATDEFAVAKALEQDLRRKRTAFVAETGTKKAIHWTMITTYGLARNAYRSAVQSEVTADDLFRET